jgi:hypothetical protein
MKGWGRSNQTPSSHFLYIMFLALLNIWHDIDLNNVKGMMMIDNLSQPEN